MPIIAVGDSGGSRGSDEKAFSAAANTYLLNNDGERVHGFGILIGKPTGVTCAAYQVKDHNAWLDTFSLLAAQA